MKELWDLYFTFLKIGAVNFGGGYAMLPLLERDLVDDKKWVSQEELLDYFAIGQCTPGVIALNVSTFIGHKRKGIIGGIVASLGFISVPIWIILVIAAVLTGFADNPYVQDAFAGIRVCVFVLIIQAVLRLWKKSVVDWKTLVMYCFIFFITVFSKVLPLHVSAAAFVICAGVLGAFIGPNKAGNKRQAEMEQVSQQEVTAQECQEQGNGHSSVVQKGREQDATVQEPDKQEMDEAERRQDK